MPSPLNFRLSFCDRPLMPLLVLCRLRSIFTVFHILHSTHTVNKKQQDGHMTKFEISSGFRSPDRVMKRLKLRERPRKGPHTHTQTTGRTGKGSFRTRNAGRGPRRSTTTTTIRGYSRDGPRSPSRNSRALIEFSFTTCGRPVNSATFRNRGGSRRRSFSFSKQQQQQ